MTTAPDGAECPQCGDRIAPGLSEYAGDGTARHQWRCAKCSCTFETRTVFDANSPLTPDLVETFLPSLLVAWAFERRRTPRGRCAIPPAQNVRFL